MELVRVVFGIVVGIVFFFEYGLYGMEVGRGVGGFGRVIEYKNLYVFYEFFGLIGA